MKPRPPSSTRAAVGGPPPKPQADAYMLAAARLQALRPPRHPRLQRAAADLQAQRNLLAEQGLTEHLDKHPTDADALNLMASVFLRTGRRLEALPLLERCLKEAPGFVAARYSLANALAQSHRFEAALAEVAKLVHWDGKNPLFRQLQANVLESMGQSEAALAICEQLVAEHPGRSETWVRLGHALRALGHQDRSASAYRRAMACRPSHGQAWWSLANLKTVAFSDAEVAAMQAQLARPDLAADDRIPLQFALGKALEDAGDYGPAFEQMALANATLRSRIEYDPKGLTRGVAANKALYTAEFFATRADAGRASAAPIFILGRPRSGSTLLEQMLASHSAIEGTAELPYVPALAARLNPRSGPAYGTDTLAALERMSAPELAALGAAYLQSASVHRRQGRPHFIDKNPANFAHVGMIHLMLPGSKIIDMRRHPAACSFSMFKSLGGKSRLRLEELGWLYRDYVDLLAHFDAVLPGRVLRVFYEDLVREPERELRRVFAYLGLPFEAACLRFHETSRTVLTPSSAQVREPLHAGAIDHWRQFEPWLAPLIESLGEAHTAYPALRL